MRDIARFDLPYAPALREMPACGAAELKRSLDGIVTPGDIQMTAHATTGALRACRLTGGGVLATVHLGRQEVRHESGHLRELAGDDVIVLVALDGKGTVTQQGRVLPFSKGDITFRRARVPSVARIDEPASLVLLRLPITRFLGHSASRHASFIPYRADAASGIVGTIHRFIDSVLPAFAHMSPVTVAAAEESLVALISASYIVLMRSPVKTQHRVSIRCDGRSSQPTLPRTCVIRRWMSHHAQVRSVFRSATSI
jgi:AraC family transcriptional activator of tynA and feaB